MKTISPERIIQITKDAVKSSFFSFFLCREEVKTRHLLLYKLFPSAVLELDRKFSSSKFCLHAMQNFIFKYGPRPALPLPLLMYLIRNNVKVNL